MTFQTRFSYLSFEFLITSTSYLGHSFFYSANMDIYEWTSA